MSSGRRLAIPIETVTGSIASPVPRVTIGRRARVSQTILAAISATKPARLGEEHGKAVRFETRDEILLANGTPQDGSDETQDINAEHHAVPIVDAREPVDVDEEEREGTPARKRERRVMLVGAAARRPGQGVA